MSDSMLVTYLKPLTTQEILKNRQNTKANSIFISRNIDLTAKTPQNRPVFSVSTKQAPRVLITKLLWQRKLH
jgi:hypothetical protein